jgi:hypothetical protein
MQRGLLASPTSTRICSHVSLPFSQSRCSEWQVLISAARYRHAAQRQLQAHPDPDRRVPQGDSGQQDQRGTPVVRPRARQRRRNRVQRVEPEQDGQLGAGEEMGGCFEGDGLEVGYLC